MYLDEARIALSPFSGQLRIGGTMEFSGLSTRVDLRRLDAIRAGSSRYLRDWPAGGEETVWARLRPLTPATAMVIAQLLRIGDAGIDLTLFRADRFARRRG